MSRYNFHIINNIAFFNERWYILYHIDLPSYDYYFIYLFDRWETISIYYAKCDYKFYTL